MFTLFRWQSSQILISCIKSSPYVEKSVCTHQSCNHSFHTNQCIFEAPKSKKLEHFVRRYGQKKTVYEPSDDVVITSFTPTKLTIRSNKTKNKNVIRWSDQTVSVKKYSQLDRLMTSLWNSPNLTFKKNKPNLLNITDKSFKKKIKIESIYSLIINSVPKILFL